ncbi:MBL fold metallo-hydrolase [Dictyobacter arantiisoli]|uniref:Metallo-beta-lactamase domain-containing protein n=1 Tax=Dictyobacter arantiisoli TaxID=2014874 RepID=A0A5A5TL16_9CHLR|nr:MBL fold metallo-hydrolase [Dictyobacter arantiisoli]GCF11806.1 hypothetical protein KDI_53700 [Dictyobacter arantiisoli]
MLTNWICVTCGTQFTASPTPPEFCPICTDQRQYVAPGGQIWTTLAKMHAQGMRNELQHYDSQLIGIGTQPKFAIGQRALFLRTGQGNILWDCITLLDDRTKAFLNESGGIQAIAISHPHFYSSMIEWARYFHAPIYLHTADRNWVMRPDDQITFWSGETQRLLDTVTLLRLGGHFPGSTVLHWSQGTQGKGILLTGDTIQVVADHQWVSFMYSYPNNIPLPAHEIQRIRDAVAPYQFSMLYGGWADSVVQEQADSVVKKSANRYIEALTGAFIQ